MSVFITYVWRQEVPFNVWSTVLGCSYTFRFLVRVHCTRHVVYTPGVVSDDVLKSLPARETPTTVSTTKDPSRCLVSSDD